jgi:hypothetical protein
MRAALHPDARATRNKRRNGVGRMINSTTTAELSNAPQHMTSNLACPFDDRPPRSLSSGHFCPGRTLPFPASSFLLLLLRTHVDSSLVSLAASPGSLVFSLYRSAQLRRSNIEPRRGCSWRSAGASLTPERSVILLSSPLARPHPLLLATIIGERDDGDDHPIEHQAAATQPPSLSMVHALERFTEGKRRARTRSPELEEGFADAVPGSKKSVGPHL